ncbi:MAG: hypothetical protein ACYSWO_13060 [Planctomycetota bacterium]
MKQITAVLSILICLAAIVGCEDGPAFLQKPPVAEPNEPEPIEPEPNEPPSVEIPTVPPAGTFEIKGTVVYKSMEGGFYAIDGDDGRKYDPIGLPESFRRDGLKVKVTARPRMDAVSIHMYGTIIEVIDIAAR